MSTIFGFGESVEGFDVPVMNEREVRAAAGILFVFAMMTFANAWFMGNFRPTKIFVIAFLIDFTIRIFINPKYSPSMIVGRFAVRKQVPEWMANPIAVFERDDGHITMIAPEPQNGQPIIIGMEPAAHVGGSRDPAKRYHLLLTAYNKDRGHFPAMRMFHEGQLRYLDAKRSPGFSRDSGLRLPSSADFQGFGAKIFTERNLVKYCTALQARYSADPNPPSKPRCPGKPRPEHLPSGEHGCRATSPRPRYSSPAS